MILSEEYVRAKVGHIKSTGRECMKVTYEMVDLLLNGASSIATSLMCKDENKVIAELNRIAQDKNSLPSVWIAMGFDENRHPGFHGLIVFNMNPLQSVSAWDQGIKIYNEAETFQFIKNSLSSVEHLNKVDVVQHQKKDSSHQKNGTDIE